MFNLDYNLNRTTVIKQHFIKALLVLLFFSSCSTQPLGEATSSEGQAVRILPPQELYGDLFDNVQTRTDLFPDSKTFVDVIPKKPVGEILAAFESLEDKETAKTVMTFLGENFIIPGYNVSSEIPSASEPSAHIENLWSYLERPADPYVSGTKIPLPNPYIVPGGRFREVYYWDSYFTMLGLEADGRTDLVNNVVANFSFLIDSVGFIPNGNRTYYATRSQPPFYALMVALSVADDSTRSLANFVDPLVKEYEFWMAGADALADGASHRRVVSTGDGEVLNRYWDDSATPRPESYREDIETVEEAVEKYPGRTKEDSYRHLRAAAESGWDFSTRWFEITEEGEFDLSSIHTTDIIPVDLNCLLYYLEGTIAAAYREQGLEAEADDFQMKAQKRKELILKYCWSETHGFFMDYDFVKKAHTPVPSLAGLYPLFFEVASQEQAKKVSDFVKNTFLMKGGVVTTLNDSGQQWDFPNGWAPLQWMTIKGLRNYQEVALADEIKRRWLELNTNVFENTGKMTEKYNVIDMSLAGGGGEYPNQDGFGWTNGVFQKLYKEEQ